MLSTSGSSDTSDPSKRDEEEPPGRLILPFRTRNRLFDQFDLDHNDRTTPTVDGRVEVSDTADPGMAVDRRVFGEGRVGFLPVILLTGRADESDRVLGLELGADDYVLKPFSPRELVARVRNLLKRQHRSAQDDRLEFGSLVVDRRTREVINDGVPVRLTPREFDLLEFLCRSPRQVFSKEQLLTQVWDSTPEWQDPATVTVHIRRLRQKLGDDPKSPRRIGTVWGVGYRFEP